MLPGTPADTAVTQSSPALGAFEDDLGKWGPHLRFIESARPDQQGRFTCRSLPSGRYVAVAVRYLEPGEERDPDRLEAWRQGGTIFTLLKGETHALDLRPSTFQRGPGLRHE